MSGELQTIPARHGVATFVPRGRTIKIINTYGKQVVSMWAFGLAAPPEQVNEEIESGEETENQIEEPKEPTNLAEHKDTDTVVNKAVDKPKEGAEDVAVETVGVPEKAEEHPATKSRKTEQTLEELDKTEKSDEYADDPPEQAPETPENEKPSEGEKPTETAIGDKKPEKRTWASYIPSIPYRSKGSAPKPETKPDPKAEKAQNEATSRKWSSYLPTGKGFSSYVPNLQVPDTKDVVSAFQASHYRDPNKSYAEQLYDFSKTPVGAGTIAGKTTTLISISATNMYSG